MWLEVQTLPLNPPFVRRAPDRPKKQRIKTNDDPKDTNTLRMHHNTVKCKRCGEYGHNNITCKGKTAADMTIPTGGNQVSCVFLSLWVIEKMKYYSWILKQV